MNFLGKLLVALGVAMSGQITKYMENEQQKQQNQERFRRLNQTKKPENKWTADEQTTEKTVSKICKHQKQKAEILENLKPEIVRAEVPQSARKTSSDKNTAPDFGNAKVYTPWSCHYLYTRETVKKLYLTEKEAVRLGFSYRKKSGNRARITNYHGNDSFVTVPTKIGKYRVNEIGKLAFFRNRTVKSIRIPESVTKIGEHAFWQAAIEICIIDGRITEIKKQTFYSCSQLFKVQFPDTLQTIGESAFEHCGNLDCVVFPKHCRNIGDYAFRWSGLKQFSVFGNGVSNGRAFVNTPLHEKYDIIRADTSDLPVHILLVGKNANLRFKNNWVVLMKNSVLNSCTLDYSEARGYPAENYAFPRDLDEYNFYNVKVRLIIPKDGRYNYPRYVDCVLPDGTPCGRFYDITKISPDTAEMKVYNSLYPYSITDSETGSAENLILKSAHPHISENAVSARSLKSIDLGQLSSFGQIFSWKCKNLHEVRWKNQDNIPVVKYIPPEKYVGFFVHQECLEAFKGSLLISALPVLKTTLFDRKPIDEMFRKGKIRLSPPNTGYLELNQKEKIMLAVDVLRSTHLESEPDNEIYRQYLRTHRRYAEILAKRFPEYDIDFSEII